MQVPEPFVSRIFSAIKINATACLTVDLNEQTVTLEDGSSASFDINPYKKVCMINGYDDIDYLLSLRDEIKQFDLAH